MKTKHKTEIITLTVKYKIGYDTNDPKCRDDAVEAAMELCASICGGGGHGCYSAYRIKGSVKLVETK